ncbi:ubiquitin fusion degradation protein UFD1 [Dictyocaulus viviparus]|uniref:Ubiquitin fusion degradation protein UFD1 n=1 Tax=Dictyocaulus viviparus TaxID=29172 RepID=A0A0D8XWA6_DICVI|nr:ubiquitin fusion degradation protein UFD1 [Dictyocaulus viviparus]
MGDALLSNNQQENDADNSKTSQIAQIPANEIQQDSAIANNRAVGMHNRNTNNAYEIDDFDLGEFLVMNHNNNDGMNRIRNANVRTVNRMFDVNNNEVDAMLNLNNVNDIQVTNGANMNENRTKNYQCTSKNSGTANRINNIRNNDGTISKVGNVNNEINSGPQEVEDDDVQIICEVLRNPGKRYIAFSHSHYKVTLKKISRLHTSGMVVLPDSAFEPLNARQISLPLCVKVSASPDRFTYCGVIEYHAPEGRAYLPAWVMRHLSISDGQIVYIQQADLPVATSILLDAMTPLTHTFKKPRDVLPIVVRNYDFVTTRDMISIQHQGKRFDLLVKQVKPEGAACIADGNVLQLTHVWSQISETDKHFANYVPRIPNKKCISFIGSPMPSQLAKMYRVPSITTMHCNGREVVIAGPTGFRVPISQDDHQRSKNDENQSTSTLTNVTMQAQNPLHNEAFEFPTLDESAPMSETIGKSLAVSILY